LDRIAGRTSSAGILLVPVIEGPAVFEVCELAISRRDADATKTGSCQPLGVSQNVLLPREHEFAERDLVG